MKNITTLSEVHKKVSEISKDYSDKFIDKEDITFNNLESINIGSESHYLRPTAQKGMANRLGIPFQYLIKCPQEVQAFNLNHWIKKERNKMLFLRFDGEEIRAVFTPRYKPLDNYEILDRLRLIGFKENNKVQCSLDNEFMLLSIPDNNKTFSIGRDEMTPGISISNSEVGLASLSISAFILRLICTNGLISKTHLTESYRHISRKIFDDFPEVISKVPYEIDRQRDQFRFSMESKVDNPEETIKNFNKQFQIEKSERDAIEWAWPFELGDTMFNIVNIYTRAAQFEELSAESSFRLQKVAGNILDLLK